MERETDIRRITTRLFKNFLIILEDLQEDHRSVYLRLLEQTPDELKPLIAQADYFDDRKMEWLRKRVLDLGNEAIRDGENYVEIHFKFRNKDV